MSHPSVALHILEGTPESRTLRRAADLCGGLPALARALEVSLDDLTAWVAATQKPPLAVYIRALEMVARSRLTRA